MKKLNLLFSLLFVHMAAPAQDAVVSPVNMNILYAGVSNPVEIAVPGIASDKVTATITNGSIKRTANGWEIQVQNAGECIVSVYSGDKKVADKKFRIKPIPAPVAVFAGKTNGVIAKETLRNAALEAKMQDFDWDMKYNISGFAMLVKEGQVEKQFKVTGNTLSEEMQSQLASLKSGQSVVFKDIRATGPDGRQRDLNAVILKID